MTPVFEFPRTEHPEVTVTADWVFAYGSLIWYPGFEPAERVLGRIRGYHRAFCIRSTVYRGTPQSPGLVLGLDYGGSCCGVALRMPQDQQAAILQALYDREMTTHAYNPKRLQVHLQDGRVVSALSFVVNRHNGQYHKVEDTLAASIISQSSGQTGRNLDYATHTLNALAQENIQDLKLQRIVHAAMRLAQAPGS